MFQSFAPSQAHPQLIKEQVLSEVFHYVFSKYYKDNSCNLHKEFYSFTMILGISWKRYPQQPVHFGIDR